MAGEKKGGRKKKGASKRSSAGGGRKAAGTSGGGARTQGKKKARAVKGAPGLEEQKGFYLKLRRRIKNWLAGKGAGHRWADYIMFAPDFFYVLMKLVADPRVPGAYKAELLFAIVYFISPVDLLPEGIMGPTGYLDDIALAAYVLDRLMNRVDSRIVEEYWPGETDLLETIQQVIGFTSSIVPVDRIRKWGRKLLDRE